MTAHALPALLRLCRPAGTGRGTADGSARAKLHEEMRRRNLATAAAETMRHHRHSCRLQRSVSALPRAFYVLQPPPPRLMLLAGCMRVRAAFLLPQRWRDAYQQWPSWRCGRRLSQSHASGQISRGSPWTRSQAIPVGQQRAGRTCEKMVIKREVKNVSERLERTAAKTA